MSYKWIRASEIGNYVYCNRAWWLREVRGKKPHNVQALNAGTQYHHQHGQVVQRAAWARKAAYVLIFVAVMLAVMQLVGT